jgi:predicted Zn-dependent peptidase
MVQETRNIRRQKLPNGLTIITEQMQHIRSASIGVWLQTGSRDEDAQWNGISHFIEHMVFKGTKNRTAEEIARQVDSIGGNMDAFTAKECICFNVKVLDEHVPTALDILSDLVLNPVFDASDIARERGVIMEEIKMDEDNPDYLVHEIFTQNFWKDHPLGKPILGTKETVKRFERDSVVDAYTHRFAPSNIIVSAAGNLDHDRFVELVTGKFEHMKPMSNGFHSSAPKIISRITLRNKKALEQVQLCIGVPAHPIAHEKRHAGYILNTVLGGGMSSRLFQQVREQRGLAYSVYSSVTSYADAGSLSIYAGCSPQRLGAVASVAGDVLSSIARDGISDAELARGKGQLRGGLVLGLEDPGSRMSRIGKAELHHGEHCTVEEALEQIDEVSTDQVGALARELLRRPITAAVVGPYACAEDLPDEITQLIA